MVVMDISAEDTLPDDAWKDSFDKLLDERPILRELNVIKRNVRASFNMNSSYENSSYNSTKPQIEEFENSTSVLPKVQYLDVPANINIKSIVGDRTKSEVVSTPIRKNSPANPFKCALSPIGPWDLRHFKCSDKNIQEVSQVGFNATPINDNVVVNVECIGDLSSPGVVRKTYPLRHSPGISPLELVRKKWKTKHVGFVKNDFREEEKKATENQYIEVMSSPLYPKCSLQPGKWRKSLNYLRRRQTHLREHGNTHVKSSKKEYRQDRTSVVERPIFSTTTISVVGKRKSICLCPNSNQTRTGSRSTYSLGTNDFKRQILQRCGQRRVLAFNSAYNEGFLQNCCKIGEGAFGEVFLYSKQTEVSAENSNKTVLKVIPIEGKELVNGEVQKTFEQILPEIIISMELCSLNDNKRTKNVTSGFVNLQKVRYVQGRYPSYLQKLWEEYDLEKESENDHPKCFTNNQQYIILELEYGGQDLDGFRFKNAEQSYYALQQIILTLAVGEREYQFEHRDLHWGNILVQNTNQQNISYKLEENLLTIPTKGIKIAIIDYTLSRMTFNDYCFYNDLSNDEELFTATGDYQFEIYRMMRKVVNNKWEKFEPKTNIFWISYIISKLVEGVKYKNIRSKAHLYYLNKLKQLQTSILTYKSCADYAQEVLLD